jgi:3-hydroxyacyl-[acyl-carrier-protein] dehydratase
MEKDAIMAVLPHRDPMLFIDRVLNATDNNLTAGTYVDPNWPVFDGHFPEFPIMPGVLLIETIAQAGALILCLRQSVAAGTFIGLASVSSAKFRRAVKPGDQMHIHVDLVQERRGFYKYEGVIDVDAQRAVEVEFAAVQMSL